MRNERSPSGRTAGSVSIRKSTTLRGGGRKKEMGPIGGAQAAIGTHPEKRLPRSVELLRRLEAPQNVIGGEQHGRQTGRDIAQDGADRQDVFSVDKRSLQPLVSVVWIVQEVSDAILHGDTPPFCVFRSQQPVVAVQTRFLRFRWCHTGFSGNCRSEHG